MNLPRSGQPTTITPRAQRRLIQEVIKEPRTTSKELQASLASIKVSVHDSTIRKRLGKNGIHGRVPRQKPLLTKKTKTEILISHLPKIILIIPKLFGQILCGLMHQKFNFLEGVCPVKSCVKPTQHFIKKEHHTNSQTWWCSVMVWGCFADRYVTACITALARARQIQINTFPLFLGGGGGWSHSVCNTVCYKTMSVFTTKTKFFERELFQSGYKQKVSVKKGDVNIGISVYNNIIASLD